MSSGSLRTVSDLGRRLRSWSLSADGGVSDADGVCCGRRPPRVAGQHASVALGAPCLHCHTAAFSGPAPSAPAPPPEGGAWPWRTRRGPWGWCGAALPWRRGSQTGGCCRVCRHPRASRWATVRVVRRAPLQPSAPAPGWTGGLGTGVPARWAIAGGVAGGKGPGVHGDAGGWASGPARWGASAVGACAGRRPRRWGVRERARGWASPVWAAGSAPQRTSGHQGAKRRPRAVKACRCSWGLTAGGLSGGSRGRGWPEQRTGADRAKGSVCFKHIVHGAAAHRGR